MTTSLLARLVRVLVLLTPAVLVGVALPGHDAAGQHDGPSGEFLALAYNVAGLPPEFSGSEPHINTPLISPLLNDYDLVLVQEDWVDPDPPVPPFDFFHDDLIAQVTHPYLSMPATPPLGMDPRRPTALVADGLNRLSRFPFGEVTRVMWPNCFGGADTSDGGAGDCLSLKGFSLTRTELAPGVEVDVYNLHGEAGSTALDEQYRAEDYEVLAAFIQDNSAGNALIVGGDFNLHTVRDEIDAAVFETFLDATDLVDVCEVVTCDDPGRIDKFLFRSNDEIEIEPLTHHFEVEKFQREDGQPLSDHDALAVTFRWTVPGDAETGDPRGRSDSGATSPALPAPQAAPTATPATPVGTDPRFTG